MKSNFLINWWLLLMLPSTFQSTQSFSSSVTKRAAARSDHFFGNRTALLTMIVIVSIAVRALFMFLFSRTFLWDGIWSDAATYNDWAKSIVVNNDWLGQEPFFMTPLYPYFLAIVYSLVGQSVLAVRIIQSAAGVGIAVLLFLLGEKAFSSRRAGFVAGLLAALYGPFLLSHNLLLVETVKMFFLTFSLWLLLVARQKKKLRWWFAGGAMLGLAVLGRPSDLLVGGVVAVWILGFTEGTSRERLARFGAFAVAIVLIIAPVTLRNYLVSGDPILITSNGGLNFYLGNNPQAVGVYYNVDKLDLANDPDGRVYLEDLLNKPLRHSEVSSIWFSRAFEFILDQPLDFIGLLGRKLLLFFHQKEISQLGYNYAFVEQTAMPLLRYFPSFLLAGSLGVLGCVLGWRHRKEFFLPYGFLAAQILGVVLFFVTDRFRLSAVPFLMLFAGYGVVEMYDCFKRKERRRVSAGAIALVGAVLIITVFNVNIPDEFSLEWECVGMMHYEERNYDGALSAYRESLRYRDTFHLHNNIGNALLALGRTDAALDQYKAGSSMNPRQPISSFSMGTAFVIGRDWPSALQAFEKAIEINPHFAPAYLNKGLTLYMMQRYPEALEYLQRYTELEHDLTKLATVVQDIQNLKRMIQQQHQ